MNSASCRVAASVELFRRPGNHCLHKAERKISSDHRQRLQQILFRRRQPIDARGENILHRGRNLQLRQRLGQPDYAVAHQRTVIEQHLHRLFHEKRIALGPFDDKAFERTRSWPSPNNAVSISCGALLAQRVQPELRVVGLTVPMMRILGPIIHQQKNSRSADRIGEQVEKRLGLLVDPVQVLEDHASAAD